MFIPMYFSLKNRKNSGCSIKHKEGKCGGRNQLASCGHVLQARDDGSRDSAFGHGIGKAQFDSGPLDKATVNVGMSKRDRAFLLCFLKWLGEWSWHY